MSTTPHAPDAIDRHAWLALSVVTLIAFLVVVDVSAVNVAFPSIRNDLNASATSLSWIVSGYNIGVASLLLVAGRLADTMGRRRIMITSMLMTAVVLVFMVFAGKSRAFIAFIAVLGFFLYAIRPVLQAWLLESTPRNMGGTSIGILFGAQSLGASIAPLIGGMIADRWGLAMTFWFLAGTIVVANLFILGMPAEGKTGDGP